MKEVKQLDISYTNERYVSVFVGICKSQELLEQYLDKDYELLCDYDCIGFEMGIDFGINTYDEDFMVRVFNPSTSNQIDVVFADAIVFDLAELKKDYPNGLDQPYNAVIVFCSMKYEGNVKEIQNEEFGYFKFLGTYEND